MKLVINVIIGKFYVWKFLFFKLMKILSQYSGSLVSGNNKISVRITLLEIFVLNFHYMPGKFFQKRI